MMTTNDETTTPTIIVPVRVLEGESIEPGIVSLLADARVVLVGYHVLPEQTPPGQARIQFEDRAEQRLTELATGFTDAGAAVETRLVFTHDLDQSIDRIADEVGADGTMVLNPAPKMDNVLIAVRGDVLLERIVTVASALFEETDIGVTLLHIAAEDDEDDGEELLDRVASTLADQGTDADRISTRIETAGRPVDRIAAAAQEHDAVVLGESDPSVTTFLFGQPSDQIAERFIGPVLRIRQPRETTD